ncbi:MAG: hypothetical protein IKD78_09770, partial [Bacteroidales bacterium]|nr:hypothetical protein [Bacteroidales bacterium]
TDAHCLRVKGFDNGAMNYELVEVQDGEVPHEALNIAESLGIDSEWISEARRFLIMANSPQLEILNPSNSRGLKTTKGVEFDPLGKKGGND